MVWRADNNDVDVITQVFLALRAAAMSYVPRLHDEKQVGPGARIHCCPTVLIDHKRYLWSSTATVLV